VKIFGTFFSSISAPRMKNEMLIRLEVSFQHPGFVSNFSSEWDECAMMAGESSKKGKA
jgi:hypothetical protein